MRLLFKGGNYLRVASIRRNTVIIVCKKYHTEVTRNELAGESGKASTCVHCRDIL